MSNVISYLLLTIFLTGCLTATSDGDQVANCPANYSFNNVQRKCIFTGGITPEPTLGLVETNEDEQTLIYLPYNKVDGKEAIRCLVDSEDQDIEYVSPLVDSVINRGDDLADEARAAYLSIPTSPSFVIQRANAQTASQNADAALTQLQTAGTTLVIVAAMESLIENARIAGQNAESVTTNSATFVQGRVTLAEADDFEKVKRSIEDRCECQNGQCKTLAKPRANFFGDSEFRYQVIDQLNRVSPIKEVINRVRSVNDLPVGTSFTVKFEEVGGEPKEVGWVSTTFSNCQSNLSNKCDLSNPYSDFTSQCMNFGLPKKEYAIEGNLYYLDTQANRCYKSVVVPPLYDFSIPLAKDIEDNLNAAGFRYELTKAPVNGTISNCLGVGKDSYVAGSYNPSFQDRTCQYRPISADMSAEGVKASFIFNGINFVAAAPGKWGEQIQVAFINKIGVANNPSIRVDGRTIYIEIEEGITTALNVFTALINDQFASTMLDFETAVDIQATSLSSASFKVIERTEFLRNGFDPHDTIEYRVFDNRGYSLYSAVIGIKIQSESDPPVIRVDRMTAQAIVVEENQIIDTNLSVISTKDPSDPRYEAPEVDDDIKGVMIVWEDAEEDNVVNCEVTIEDGDNDPNTGFELLRECGCVDTNIGSNIDKPICSFLVMPWINTVGTFTKSIKMKVTSSDGLTDEKYLPVTVTSAPDKPLPISINTENFIESNTAFAPENGYTINIPKAFDPDESDTSTYTLVDPPQRGKLSDCLGFDGTDGTDIDCVYKPDNGNLTRVGRKAELTIQSLKFISKFSGNYGENISIEIIDDQDLSDGKVIISNVGLDFTIRLKALSVSATELRTELLNEKRSVLLPLLVDIVLLQPEDAPMAAQTRVNLIGGEDGADFFTYRANDGTDEGVALGFVNIDIYPENDQATICQYSKFNDAPECGINGCIGKESPLPKIENGVTVAPGITPSAVGLKYYQEELAVCYISTGTSSAANWDVINAIENPSQLISDQNINEKDILVIDEIRIDEGGGSATFDNCTFNQQSVCRIGSDTVDRECAGDGSPSSLGYDVPDSNESLIPAADPILYFDRLNTVCYQYDRIADSWSVAPPAFNPLIDEDTQKVIIDSVTSSNSNLIPIENITFEWRHEDPNRVQTETYTGTDLEFGRLDVSEDKYPFRIYIQPQLGQIQDGNSATSTITFNVRDKDGSTLGNAINVSFDVTVNAVAAIHNGWSKILAFGPKINKNETILESNHVCTYHRDMCNGGEECKGAGDPSTLGVTADDTFAIFYNTSSDKCYYFSTASSAWIEFESYCAISHSRDREECGGTAVSCINNGDPNGSYLSSGINTFYYDKQNNKCYRSTKANSNSDWEEYKAPGEVTIGWENFSIVGQASITGFNIYRRLAGEEYDYDRPINKELLTINTNEYVDNAENSYYPPIPGTTYYYEVRPFVNDLLTGTNEIFNTVRVLVPPNNMTLVHRWMANLTMCKILHKDGITVADGGIDPRNNYRCAYEGPGNTFITDRGYYDFGKDLLVDRYEVGCNYSPSPACNGTYDNSCIGDEEPLIAGVTANENSIYYNRSNGKCYVRKPSMNSATLTWNEVGFRCEFSTTCEVSGVSGSCTGEGDPVTRNVEATASDSIYYDSKNDKCYIATDYPTSPQTWKEILGKSSEIDLSLLMANANTPQNPPLVYVTQKEASSMCYHSPALPSMVGVTQNRLDRQLPTRKEHLVFSQWDSSKLSANTIITMETGLSINSSSKCNSSSASGLESFYSDSPKPSSSVLYTIPGTATSEIRSVMTGSGGANLQSFGTQLCQSKFGIQDSIGNVAEWVVERMKCTSTTSCEGASTTDNPEIRLQNTQEDITWREITTGACPVQSSGCDLSSPYTVFSESCSGGIGWEATSSSSCTVILNLCDQSSPFTSFDQACEGATDPDPNFTNFPGRFYKNTTSGQCFKSVLIKPKDGMANVAGKIYVDTATGKCYESVPSFRGTNDDFKVQPIGGTGDYSIFSVGGAGLISSDGTQYYQGPCKDTNADDICDDYLEGWRFEEEKFDAGAMFVPMGLPVHRDFNFFSSTDLVADSIAEIGPSSGITTANLHDDALYLNTHEIFSDHTNCGAMAVGGSYLDGGDSGSYFFRFLPCGGEKLTHNGTSYSVENLNDNQSFAVIGDLSFKGKPNSLLTTGATIQFNAPSTYCSPVESVCDVTGNGSGDGTANESCSGADAPNAAGGGAGVIAMTLPGNATTFKYIQSSGGVNTCWEYTHDGASAYAKGKWSPYSEPLQAIVTNNNISVNLGIDVNGNVISTASDVKAAIDTALTTFISGDDSWRWFEVIVSGDGSNNQSAFDDPISFDNNISKNKDVDIGFRCVVPITDYALDETD